MSERLAGKTCFVTAAGQGIGRAIVTAFLSEGARVVATDLHAAGLQSMPAHSRLSTAVLDATDAAAVSTAASRYRDVEVLVNCAGHVAKGTVLDDGHAVLETSLRINVLSMAATIAAFLPAMIERRRGSIVNVASVVSSVRAAPDRFAYATSKAAVIGLTMSVARDFVGQGVRCNAISPGTTDTPSLRDRAAATADARAALDAFIARQPMGRLGKAEEIASIAVMLASDESSFMTGSNVIVDGGMSL